jgi:biopolymer transport protein ExbD
MAITTSDTDEPEAGGESMFADINITPLTDVFLVMVVVFMVSALAVQGERIQEKRAEKHDKALVHDTAKPSGVHVTLPHGDQHDVDPKRTSLTLELTPAGGVHVGGKLLRDADLEAVFRKVAVRDRETQVILRADTGVQLGRAVQIMERARLAGLARIAIATNAKP